MSQMPQRLRKRAGDSIKLGSTILKAGSWSGPEMSFSDGQTKTETPFAARAHNQNRNNEMIHQAVRALSRGIYSIADASGISSAMRDSWWLRRRLLILCWHGISLNDEHFWSPGLYITPALFRRRLEILAEEKYNVLPLEEAVSRLQLGSLPPRAVAITFDDGFHDFRHHAAPILAEFGFS